MCFLSHNFLLKSFCWIFSHFSMQPHFFLGDQKKIVFFWSLEFFSGASPRKMKKNPTKHPVDLPPHTLGHLKNFQVLSFEFPLVRILVPRPPGNPLFSPECRGRGGDRDNLQSSNGEISGKGRASTQRVFGEYSPQIPLIRGRGRGTYSFSFEENSRTGIV